MRVLQLAPGLRLVAINGVSIGGEDGTEVMPFSEAKTLVIVRPLSLVFRKD